MLTDMGGRDGTPCYLSISCVGWALPTYVFSSPLSTVVQMQRSGIWGEPRFLDFALLQPSYSSTFLLSTQD
jgi:hypothetical protein